MATTKEGVEQVLRGAFVGKRLRIEMMKEGKCLCCISFRIETARIEDEEYLAVYSSHDEGKFELIEIGRAITLADGGEIEFTRERGILERYVLEKERRNSTEEE